MMKRENAETVQMASRISIHSQLSPNLGEDGDEEENHDDDDYDEDDDDNDSHDNDI